MKTRTCHALAIALTTALMSPLAFGQNSNSAAYAADRAQGARAQETPRPALPPAVNQPQPVAADPRMPTEQADPQELEEPMTSPKTPPVQSQGAANAAGQSAVTQRTAWAELDADGDGRVSSAEGNIDADFTSHFSMMDSDGDGFVTDAEYRAHAKTSQDESQDDLQDDVQDNPPPPTPAQGAAHAAGHSSVVQRDMWSRLDTDGDGRISSVEGSIDADFTTNFAMTDTDGDGFVSDAEYRAQAKAVHQGDTGDDAMDRDDAANDDAANDMDDQDAVDAPVDDRDER